MASIAVTKTAAARAAARAAEAAAAAKTAVSDSVQEVMSTAMSSFSVDEDLSDGETGSVGGSDDAVSMTEEALAQRAARASESVQSGDGMTVPFTEVTQRGDKGLDDASHEDGDKL